MLFDWLTTFLKAGPPPSLEMRSTGKEEQRLCLLTIVIHGALAEKLVHGKWREIEATWCGQADQNLIVPHLSPGQGTQSYTAAPLLFLLSGLGFVSHVCLHLLHSQRRPILGTSCFVPPALALGAFTVRETKPETVFLLKCNLALQERERKRWLVM